MRKEPTRGAHRDIYEKTVAFESPHRDEGGRDGRVHAAAHRPIGPEAFALWVCRQRCREVHDVRAERTWRDLSMRKLPLNLCYRPRRVDCPRCGVRVEDFPWAEAWARVTTDLSNAVAVLARELSWQGTARQYGLNWKSVATIVKRAVQYGLKNRDRPAVHAIGMDAVSRRKGQVYLPGVYELERRGLLWGGEDRTE